MGAIAASSRRTTYNPVVSTTNFAVNFPIFDNADLLFFLDGEAHAFTVTATYVDGVSTDAVCVVAPGVTGAVEIIGLRTPRRTDQYSPGAPLPIRDHNYSLNRLTIESQEARRDVDRAWKSPYGIVGKEITVGVNGNVPKFDADGNLVDSGYSAESAAGVGDVIGPVSSILNRIAIFASATGKLIADSGVLISDLLAKAGGTMTGFITLHADPSSAMHAVTKQYVDAIAVNLGKRARVRAATTANIAISTALNNGDSLDSVVLATGDLVLVKNQTAPAENGVYVVGAVPARAVEFDSYNEHPGSLIAVAEGTANADALYLCTSNDGGTLGVTAIVFTQMRVSGELLAANNLSDVANAATAFANIKQAASETVTGVVEMATTAEAAAGVDTQRATTPAGVAAAITALGAGGAVVVAPVSASGTAVDFTGLPAGVKWIEITIRSLSSNGTSAYIIQIGDSGGVETTGYLGTAGNAGALANPTTGFGLANNGGGAGDVYQGTVRLSLHDAATFAWTAGGNTGRSNSASAYWSSGGKALSAVLDRVRVTTVNGTDTFDGGTVGLVYGT